MENRTPEEIEKDRLEREAADANAMAAAFNQTNEGNGAAPVEDSPARELTEYEQKHKQLHDELAALADGRTEDKIGLGEPYWNKKTELRQWLQKEKDKADGN